MGTARLKLEFIPPPTRHLETRSVIPDLSLMFTFLLFQPPSLFLSPTFFSRIDSFSTLIFSKMRRRRETIMMFIMNFSRIENCIYTIWYSIIFYKSRNLESINWQNCFTKMSIRSNLLQFPSPTSKSFSQERKKREKKLSNVPFPSFPRCLPRHLSHATETKTPFHNIPLIEASLDRLSIHDLSSIDNTDD